MSMGEAVQETVELVSFPGGPRLRCTASPVAARVRGCVLLAPPFAEELNKTRRMCALLSRLLAADGWRVVRLDLYGCGDSAGEFRDASWERWVDDLRIEAGRSLAGPAGADWLWCVRAGSLFASALLDVAPHANLLLWQPVLSGATYLQQFLRLAMAAKLMDAGKLVGDAPTPAQALAAGTGVEVGGYELSPAIAQGLQAASLPKGNGQGRRAVWLEVSADEPATCSHAAIRSSRALSEAGWSVDLEAVNGAPFWQTTEVVENKALLERSRDLLASASNAVPTDQRHAA